MSDNRHGSSFGAGTQCWQILGGLRFYLAAIVVSGHLSRFIRDDSLFDKLVLQFGRLDPVAAVVGFLVISGFSIAHSVSQKPRGYYRRRFIRIYPLYVLGVLGALSVHFLKGPFIPDLASGFRQADGLTVAGNFLFLQGFVVHAIEANRPLWTLAVEVFCYLFAPLLLRLRMNHLLAIMSVSLLAYTAFPKLHLDFYSRLLWGEPVLFLGWAWIGGFALYRARADLTFTIFVLVVGTFALTANNIALTRFAPFTFAVSVAVLSLSARIRIPKIVAGVLSYAGELSYPLYIVHLPLLIFGFSVLGLRDGIWLWGLALLGAALAYHLVDSPLRHRRRRRADQALPIEAPGPVAAL